MGRKTMPAFILAFILMGAVLVGCGGGAGSSETPQEAAKAFFKAYENKNVDSVWSMLSENTREKAGSNGKAELEKYVKELGSISFTVGKVTTEGDKATARVTATVSGQKSTEDIPLVKENGEWKVDMASSGSTTD